MQSDSHPRNRRTGFVPGWLPPFWAVITMGYALVIAYRMAVIGVWPSLPTAAAVAAITAVWLELADRSRGTGVTGVAVALAMSLTLLGNAYLAMKSYRTGGDVPVGRAAASLLFAYLLINKLLQLRADGEQRRARNLP